MSVCMEHFGLYRIDFHEIRYMCRFRKSVEKIQVSLKPDKKCGYLDEDVYKVLTLPRSILLSIRNASDKICRGNQNKNFVFKTFFLVNRVSYEIRWENIVELGNSQITIWRMRIACWINKAIHTYTHTHTHTHTHTQNT